MQHFTRAGPHRLARHAVQAVGIDWILSLFEALRHSWRLRRTAETLQALDDRTLTDIGLRRDEIEAVVRGRSRHR
jgi:uncharacterized protein YjiS (DUF1127 family)